jgi:hypothetical protein
MKHEVLRVLLDNMTNGSLLHLDDLFKMTGMPVVRAGAYGRDGGEEDDQSPAPAAVKEKKKAPVKHTNPKKHKAAKH